MPDVIVKELYPHCGRKTILWLGDGEGVLEFRSCVYCKKSLKDLSWRKKALLITRDLALE